jgi:hypothetical protein
MPTKQQDASLARVQVIASPQSEVEAEHPKKTTTGRQDLVFAVKLFGIAGLVVLAFWFMNRMF